MTNKSKVVETLSGPVQGKAFQFEDSNGSAFLGIPYAKPPTGELRFQKPVPTEKWTQVRECTEFSTGFPYKPVMPDPNLKFGEDSLHLNVFVSDAQKEEKAPVLFYIHGGGFAIESAAKMGDEGICKYLCSKGVVVVTINYRLGIFGFLTLENEQVKGNYGMWDMALALKWTKENIGAFGGDPNRITVCGQSAGAASTDLLTLSPHTRDLFKQAIIFAGTSHCEWVYMDGKLSRKVSIEYAKHLGCKIQGKTDEEINTEVLNFFKNCDAQKLALGIYPNPEFKFYPDLTLPYGPCYDGDFFPKSLEELRKEAPKKSVINGITEFEGLLFVTRKAMQPELSFKQVTTQALRSIRPDLSPEFLHKVCTHEIGEKDDDECHEHVKKCVHTLGDFMFNDGALEMAEIRAKKGDNVYNFIFSYYRKNTLGPLGYILPFEGATHCMELPYIFGKSILSDFEVHEDDKPVIDLFTTYLSTFMKTGDPNNDKYPEKWEKFEHGKGNPYFLFGNNEFGTRKGFGNNSKKSWNEVFSENPRKCHI